MLTPAKAITAGALAFAVGGMFLIAQPFDGRGGGVPGASTDGERRSPVEFTGRLLHGSPMQEWSTETVDGVIEERDRVFKPFVQTMSDSRLEGSARITTNVDVHGGEDGVLVNNKAFRIENDAGAWQEVPGIVLTFPDRSTSNWTSTFVGEGDYEGLVAIADVIHDPVGGIWDLHGFIVDGDLPPDPAPVSAE